MKEYVDLEVQEPLEKANKAITKLLWLNSKKSLATSKEREQTEYEVHLASRELYSRFHSIETWGSGTNTTTVKAVGTALRKAVSSVALDANCRKSVQSQLGQFRKLIDSRRERKKVA